MSISICGSASHGRHVTLTRLLQALEAMSSQRWLDNSMGSMVSRAVKQRLLPLCAAFHRFPSNAHSHVGMTWKAGAY